MPGTAYRIYTLPASILQSASKNLLPVNKAGPIFLQTMLMCKSDGGRCPLNLNSYSTGPLSTRHPHGPSASDSPTSLPSIKSLSPEGNDTCCPCAVKF